MNTLDIKLNINYTDKTIDELNVCKGRLEDIVIYLNDKCYFPSGDKVREKVKESIWWINDDINNFENQIKFIKDNNL